MIKKITTLGLGLAFFAFPIFATAQSTGTQDQIDALLAQIQLLQAQIAQLQSNSTSASCVSITRNLAQGSSGADVTNLQNYLIGKSYLTGTTATGYYGTMTATAVGRLQISLGILVSSNDPGYGTVGPKTRGMIGCGGGGMSVDPSWLQQNPVKNALTASKVSGSNPLTVEFSVDANVSPPFNIDFGDGQTESVGGWGCADSADCANWRPTWSHTYGAAGMYTATLSQHIGGPMGPEQLLDSVTITVK